MVRVVRSLILVGALAGAAPPPAAASDPGEKDFLKAPRRGVREVVEGEGERAHVDWNYLGRLMEGGKEELGERGVHFNLDLAFFDQHASRVVSDPHNFGTFSWRLMGDWQLFDLSDGESASALGAGSLSWNAFGTAGFNYDPAKETLTGNVGAVNILNATVFGDGAVVDELYWSQLAMGGRLTVLAGKIDLLYHFDTNRVANDGFSQFFSYSLQNNPSIPAPIYGGFGGVVRVNVSERAYAMFGVGDSSVESAVLPWVTLQNDSWYQLLELGATPEIPLLGSGTYRLTPWHNRLFDDDGYGIALNIDQELGRKDIVGFFRFGHGDEDVTPVKTFVSGGVAFEGPFGRAHDLAGIGVAWSDPSSGAGFRDETLLELVYRVEVFSSIRRTTPTTTSWPCPGSGCSCSSRPGRLAGLVEELGNHQVGPQEEAPASHRRRDAGPEDRVGPGGLGSGEAEESRDLKRHRAEQVRHRNPPRDAARGHRNPARRDLGIGEAAGDQEAGAAQHVGGPDQEVLLLPRQARDQRVQGVEVEEDRPGELDRAREIAEAARSPPEPSPAPVAVISQRLRDVAVQGFQPLEPRGAREEDRADCEDAVEGVRVAQPRRAGARPGGDDSAPHEECRPDREEQRDPPGQPPGSPEVAKRRDPGRQRKLGDVRIGNEMRTQPLAVASRAGDDVTAVRQALQAVGDEGTEPSLVNGAKLRGACHGSTTWTRRPFSGWVGRALLPSSA
jgi:carbohydrate-selective porin OprB